MDNLSLEVLISELRARVLNTSIQRIRFTTDRTWVLALRSRVTEYLVVSLQPAFSGLFVLSEEAPAEAAPSDALLALRKYLIGGRITALRKALADRVVFLEIENCRLSDQAERFVLALELIPNKARACLLDAQQEVQVWLSQAPPAPLGAYIPPVMPVRRVDAIEPEEFHRLFQQVDGASRLASIFGLSPLFAREVFFQGQQDSGKAWNALQALLQRVLAGPYSPRIYRLADARTASLQDLSRKQPPKLAIAPFSLESLGAAKCQTFSSMNALCAEMFKQ
ncbi:MAG: NFACT family protein, partial [Acidobacteriales bacterium]|nr:NFACT family protein [Terriglobales bacterium]